MSLVKQMYETALHAGLPIISADKCCRLLAWVYVYGGGCEQLVLDERLSNAVFYAQNRMNIKGGEIPDPKLVPVLQSYVAAITDKHERPLDNPPKWVTALEHEYGIKR